MKRVSGEPSDEQLRETLRGLVEQELLRSGKRAVVRREGDSLLVGKGATEARADIRGTLAQWDNLPDDLRERRVRQIAELLGQTPAAAPVIRRQQRQRLANRPAWYSFLAPVLVVLGTGAALVVAYQVLSPGVKPGWPTMSGFGFGSARAGASAAPLAPASDPEADRATRTGSACEQTRARVARGASIGPADVDGWVVELVLFRRAATSDLAAAPQLDSFVRRKPGASAGTWFWPNAKSLISAQRFDAEVSVLSAPTLGDKKLSGVRLVFSGPYVTPYFSEDLRSDYLLIADALADALSATDGALFAHCAGTDPHYVGSWFLGPNPGAAAGSLVYFMTAFDDVPVLKPDVLGAGNNDERRGRAFDTISRAAVGLDRGAAATIIGRELGMISGRPNKPFRLTFPFRDANRAKRSAVEVARALRLASAG